MLSEVPRLLLLGLVAAIAAAGVALALDVLAGLGDWRQNAYLLLAVATLLFALLAVRVGNLLPEHAATRASYAESIARSVSQANPATAPVQSNPIRAHWLWPIAPLLATMILIGLG